MRALLIAGLLMLTSCSALQNAATKIGEAVDFGKELRTKIASVEGKIAQAGAAISGLDKDMDGKTSVTEWLAGIGGILGIFGVRNAMSAKDKKRALEAKNGGA